MIPTDPLFNLQWHLLNTGQTGGTAGIDINVVDVWDEFTGQGVDVGIIDNGFDIVHRDLDGNYDTTRDLDLRDGDDDASAVDPGTSAQGGDNHGTQVAGVVGAEQGNDFGVVGVAYQATLIGYRIGFGNEFTLGDLVSALQQQVNVDVSNNSYGFGGFFTDDFGSIAFQGVANAIENAVTNGRDGLGTVFVFAAGNGFFEGDNVNYHNLQNSRHTIAVAAIEDDGSIAPFSTPGSALLVSAPGVEIFTTDRSGSAGDSTGDFFTGGADFFTVSGTSFSSPITAGVVALMLEANPGLGYRDVQEILAYSARQIDPSNPSWDVNGATNWNGGGLHVSDD